MENKRNRGLVLLLAVLVVAATVLGVWVVKAFLPGHKVEKLAKAQLPQWVDVQLIDVDGAARRGDKLEDFADIVVHYIGNPGTSAQQNRDYFNTPGTQVSAHFIIGLNGEVIQCVPLDEKSSASNERNRDTISIEVCHPDETGAFTQASYDSLVRLVAFLCGEGGLSAKNIIRHYDVTGKMCPLYYVEHPNAWAQFKLDVQANL